MFAIVDLAGQQFKVEKNQNIFVHRLQNEEGATVTFDKVLLIANDSKVNIGEPLINGACVTARILKHLKGDKVIIFKKKRRKGYQLKRGHRQFLTQIAIESIEETTDRLREVKAAVAGNNTEAAVSIPDKENMGAAENSVLAEEKPKVKKTAPVKKASSKPKPKVKVKEKKTAPKKTGTKIK